MHKHNACIVSHKYALGNYKYELTFIFLDLPKIINIRASKYKYFFGRCLLIH